MQEPRDIHHDSNPSTETQTPPTPPKRHRRVWKWVVGIVALVLLLPVIIVGLLYLPPVQSFVIKTVSQQISKRTGWDVSVGSFHLGLPLSLKVADVLALTQERDTIAYLSRLEIDVPLTAISKTLIPVSDVILETAHVDFFTPDSTLYIKGQVGDLRVHNASFDLEQQKLTFSSVRLADTNAYVYYKDDKPKPPKPKSEPSRLKLYFGKVDIENTVGAFAMDRDTCIVDITLYKAQVANAEVNIENAFYRAEKILLDGDIHKAGPDLYFLPYPWDAKINLYKGYYDDNHVRGQIESSTFGTGDGWQVRSLNASVDKDKKYLTIKDLDLQLKTSHLSGDVQMPFAGWIPDSIGDIALDLKGVVLMEEVSRFVPIKQEWPTQPISLKISGKGQMHKDLTVQGDVRLRDVVAVSVDGKLSDILHKDRAAALKVKVATDDVMETLALFGLSSPSWRIPQKLELDGEVEYSPLRISTRSKMSTPYGHLLADGYFLPRSKAYRADVDIADLDVRQFLPRDTIGVVRARLLAEGRGLDIFSPSTVAHIALSVDSIRYKQATLRDVSLISHLEHQQFAAHLHSPNPILHVDLAIEGTVKRDDIAASVNLQVDTIVPSYLGVHTDLLSAASLQLRSSLRSDLKESHYINGEIENIHLATNVGDIHPTNVYISALSSSDSLRASVKSGDFLLDFSALNGLKDFTSRISKLTHEIKHFTADTTGITDLSPWIKLYPDMNLSLTMGRANPLRTYMDKIYLGWRKLSLSIGTSTDKGLSGELYVDHFQKDGFRVDEMDAVIRQDSAFFYTVASIHKEKFKDQQPFNAMLSLTTNVHRTELFTQVQDKNEESVLQLGLDMTKQPNNDLKFSFTPGAQILAYNHFDVKGGNFLVLPAYDRKRIQADIDLLAQDQAAISIKSASAQEHHQDTLSLSIKNFTLERIKNLSFVPDMDGIINLDADRIQTGNSTDYTAYLRVKDFKYDKKDIGSIIVAGHTRPQPSGTYAIAQVALNGALVADAKALIPQKDSKQTKWTALISSLPLEKANPFLPKDKVELSGLLNADLRNFNTSEDIQTANTGAIEGTIHFDQASVFVPIINESYALSNKPIHIKRNVLSLDDFDVTTNTDTKLVANGYVHLNEDLRMNVSLKGTDMLLLDSKRTDKTMLYGTIGADANLKLKGPARALNVSGNISINGNTNVTYVAQDSPLERGNKFAGLIEFTDFSDTLFVAPESPIDSLSLGGMNIRLALHIDPALRATAILTKDETNKAYIQGGGDLNFSLPPYGVMTLNGIFEIRDGYILYNFPPFSRKFIVDKDSRISWAGNVLNPNLNFKATTRIKTDVATQNESTRKVNFDVSVQAKNNVDNLSLLFSMDSPEDLSMRNNIMAMTEEERSRQAIMLLATGMYFGGQGIATSGFDVNSALSSLLATQFNNLVGEALNAEINFGIEGANAETGRGTNYSYSIAKRFYDDRISFIVGGQVETGNTARNLTQSFINNMSIDYRLDKAGTHYVRLFHKKNYENLLDGEVIETGIGYVLRRRMNKLRDLFRFRTRSPQPPLRFTTEEEEKKKDKE